MTLNLLEGARRVLGWEDEVITTDPNSPTSDLYFAPMKRDSLAVDESETVGVWKQVGVADDLTQASAVTVTNTYGRVTLMMLERHKPKSVAIKIGNGVNPRAAGHGIARALLRPGIFKTAFSKGYYAGPDKVRIGITCDPEDRERLVAEFWKGVEYGRYENFACWLTALPPNVLNPVSFDHLIADLFDLACTRNQSAKASCINVTDEEVRKMQLLQGVGGGSCYKPRVMAFVVHPSTGATKQLRGFCGKGMTYDSGGLGIKPAAGMLEMYMDMGGAAQNVAAMLYALANPNMLTHSTVFGVAIAENMVDANAYRNGDILVAYNGTTVRVIHTDAEGRLVLADLLAYLEARYMDHGVSAFVDMLVDATLTGHAHRTSGDNVGVLVVRGNDPDVRRRYEDMAAGVGDPVQVLNLTAEHLEVMVDDIADLRNLSELPDGALGAQTAAGFCSRFVEDGVLYLHHDVARIASRKGSPRTGRAKGLPVDAGFAFAVQHLST